jgi:hypothetical protein
MEALVIALLTMGAAIQPPAASPASFTGKWTSAEVPPPGEAPMGPPSFDVAVKDGKTILTFARQPAGEPLVYSVYAEPPVKIAGRLTLFLSQQTPKGVWLYLVRFLDARRAEVDLFLVSSDPAKPGTHVLLGIYTRGK